jgi:hypothetical protein
MKIGEHFYQFPVPTQMVLMGEYKPHYQVYGRYWRSRSVYTYEGKDMTYEEYCEIMSKLDRFSPDNAIDWPMHHKDYYWIEKYENVGDDGHTDMVCVAIVETDDPQAFIKEMFEGYR